MKKGRNAGVSGGMDLPTDEPQPAKHQKTGVDADEDDAGESVKADDDEIPELKFDDGDEMMEQAVMSQYAMESDDESEAGAPGLEEVATRLEEGPELELPNAKRSRLSRINEMQNLCRLEKVKSRNDVKEIIRQLEKSRRFDVKAADKQRQRMQDCGANDVSEVYSPPRVAVVAERMGLQAGWSLDLTGEDADDGLPWDFSNPAKRAKAMQKVRTEKPFALITSPMCGPFSALQSLFNYPKMAKVEVKRKLSEAMIHVRFCMELCQEQHANGRLFVFEHPTTAASWCLQAVQQIRQMEGVHVVKFDFCMLGMLTSDRAGNPGAAKKRTTVMTNSPAVAMLLREAQCRSEHQHIPLLEGRAGPCQEYPDQFCELICEGIKREKETLLWRDEVGRRHKLLACSHQWRLPDTFEAIRSGATRSCAPT